MEINKIYNMDCLIGMKDIKDESIDLVVTDPPYKTTSRGNAGTSGGMLQKKINRSGSVFKYNDIKTDDYIKEIYRVLKKGTHCYIMTNHVNLHEIMGASKKAGLHFIKSLIWDKGNKIMGRAYMSQFEYVLFFRKGEFKQINNCGTTDILRIPNSKTQNSSGGNIHDTEKPVRLMEVLIENSSNKGDIILDPFMGSGTTAIACKNLARKYIGYEIDEQYYHVINKRLNDWIDQITLF